MLTALISTTQNIRFTQIDREDHIHLQRAPFYPHYDNRFRTSLHYEHHNIPLLVQLLLLNLLHDD